MDCFLLAAVSDMLGVSVVFREDGIPKEIIRNWTSLQFSERVRGGGGWILTAPFSEELVNRLTAKGAGIVVYFSYDQPYSLTNDFHFGGYTFPYIPIDRDADNGPRFGFARSVQDERDVLTIQGMNDTAILNRRVVIPDSGQSHYNKTKNPATGLGELVLDQIGSGADAHRQLANLTIVTTPLVDPTGSTINIKARYANLAEVIQGVLESWNSTHDEHAWYRVHATINGPKFQVMNGNPQGLQESQYPSYAIGADTFETFEFQDSPIVASRIYMLTDGVGSARNLVSEKPFLNQDGVYESELAVDRRDLTGTGDADIAKSYFDLGGGWADDN